MANRQIEAIRKELHPQAERLAKDYINDFATSLILQAKTLAHNRRADVVLSNHIEEALDTMYSERKQPWSKELMMVLGGAFFGAFIQGFITALSAGDALLISVYTILGFLGMFLVFVGLRK
jgi:hypothetical protein